MHEDKWKDTKAMVKEKFTVLAEGKDDLEDIPNATLEFIEFSAKGGSASGGESSQGIMRLEYTIRPAVLDKKTTYSKHGGAASNVEYVYSKDEMVRKMSAFKLNETTGEWEEVRAPLV
ncbi:hypothetical protein HY477_03005 [Candidatus Uhrbacteria bacterium]|nr:hypothetical protein [Candidatus Uhrbacteria bacterium]